MEKDINILRNNANFAIDNFTLTDKITFSTFYMKCFLCKSEQYDLFHPFVEVFIKEVKNHLCQNCIDLFYCKSHLKLDKCVVRKSCLKRDCQKLSEVTFEKKLSFLLDDGKTYYSLHNYCDDHSVVCSYGSLPYKFILYDVGKCRRMCKYLYYPLKIDDLDFDLPIEIKLIIFEYFQFTNGCGRH